MKHFNRVLATVMTMIMLISIHTFVAPVFASDIETSSVELAHALVNGVYGTYKAKIYRMD